MIKYALVCECSSKFEGWFPTNEGYENQLAQGQVVCPMCDSTKVRKDIMAPNVKKKTTQIKIKYPQYMHTDIYEYIYFIFYYTYHE